MPFLGSSLGPFPVMSRGCNVAERDFWFTPDI